MLKAIENLHQLPQLKDSISYIYIEHAAIEQDSFSIAMITKDGKTPIPIAGTSCLLLGPGTTITHAAIRSIAECGCMIVWCGENIRKYYAIGKGETNSSKNILLQAKLLSNEETRLQVVRNMYMLRFPTLPKGNYTLQQLRGMEGVRVKQAYNSASKAYGIPWRGREYKIKDIDASDDVNRTLTIANDLLYSICHAAIVSLGYSPALGFIHTGKSESFVFDVADFYKASIAIPAAFEAASLDNYDKFDETVRRCCRKRFTTERLLQTIAKDIATVLQVSETECNDQGLWDMDAVVASGVNYAISSKED